MRLGSNSPSNIYNIIHNLRQINKFTNFNTRQKFINGLVIGKLNYMLPLYANASKLNIQKLHKIVMTAARCVIGNYCFKQTK